MQIINILVSLFGVRQAIRDLLAVCAALFFQHLLSALWETFQSQSQSQSSSPAEFFDHPG